MNQIAAQYKPGTHILAELRTIHLDKLTTSSSYISFISQQISTNNLVQVGYTAHNFAGGGYSVINNLSESHIAIHTWPEYNLATLDVFACNNAKDNSGAVAKLFAAITAYFEAEVHNKYVLKR